MKGLHWAKQGLFSELVFALNLYLLSSHFVSRLVERFKILLKAVNDKLVPSVDVDRELFKVFNSLFSCFR